MHNGKYWLKCFRLLSIILQFTAENTAITMDAPAIVLSCYLLVICYQALTKHSSHLQLSGLQWKAGTLTWTSVSLKQVKVYFNKHVCHSSA